MPKMQMTNVQAADIQHIVKRGFQILKENKKNGVWQDMGEPRFMHGQHGVCRFHHDPKHAGGFQAEFYDLKASVGAAGALGVRRIRGCYGTKKAWQKIVDVLCITVGCS